MRKLFGFHEVALDEKRDDVVEASDDMQNLRGETQLAEHDLLGAQAATGSFALDEHLLEARPGLQIRAAPFHREEADQVRDARRLHRAVIIRGAAVRAEHEDLAAKRTQQLHDVRLLGFLRDARAARVARNAERAHADGSSRTACSSSASTMSIAFCLSAIRGFNCTRAGFIVRIWSDRPHRS